MANEPVTSEATPTGAGPGYSYLSGWLIVTLAVYLVVVTGVALYAMVELWPHPTPAGEPPPAEATTDTTTTATTTTDKPAANTPAANTPAPNTPASNAPANNAPPNNTTATTTTGSETKAAAKGEIPWPTDDEIKKRQDRLCAEKDTECRKCVAREMQLRYESQRAYDPKCVRIFGCIILLWEEERLLLLVLLGGAIGALLHSLRYLSWFVGSRTFRSSWTAYYYLSPLAGAAVAFVAYVAIRGGFFSSRTTTADTNTFMFVALAAIAGLFSREVLEKLKKIAESTFEPAPKTTDSLPKPAIASFDPGSVPVNFSGPVKVNGSGFTKDSKVHIGGAAMATTFDSDKQLTFELPATSTTAAGKIDVTIVNAGGTASEAKPIEVRAG